VTDNVDNMRGVREYVHHNDIRAAWNKADNEKPKTRKCKSADMKQKSDIRTALKTKLESILTL